LLREAASDDPTHSLLADAREWLRAALADGPRSARDIMREAGDAGIGRNLLYTARKLESVAIVKERIPGGRWVWSYPTGAGELPAVVNTQEVQEVRCDGP